MHGAADTFAWPLYRRRVLRKEAPFRTRIGHTSRHGITHYTSHSLEDPHVISAIRNHWNDLDWRDEATCRDLDPELFFPVGVTGMAVEQIEAAKSFCRVCPSQGQCLEFAITTNQEYGVWGATTEDERRVLRRQWRAEVRRRRVA